MSQIRTNYWKVKYRISTYDSHNETGHGLMSMVGEMAISETNGIEAFKEGKRILSKLASKVDADMFEIYGLEEM